MSDDLRTRYAEAVSSLLDQPNGYAYRGMLPDRLMAVRDEEVERLRAEVAADDEALSHVNGATVTLEKRVAHWRERAEEAEAALARARALHPSREATLCVECVIPAPCPTRRALDGDES